jgi:hypothetical protein
MENPIRATFYFYEESEEKGPVEALSKKQDLDTYEIKIGDQVKIYIKPYNLISNYTAIVKELAANIAFIEITTLKKRELVKISLKDHLIKKI